MRIEIDYAEATFQHEGQTFEAIGGVVHNTTTDDVGIGGYEYWGHREYNSDVVEISEYKDAEFIDVRVYTPDDEMALNDPSPSLLEAAQEALFNKTYETAEQQAAEAA
jgi:hypothetical protein